jgi:uracil-DNA glycosylase family 4
MSCENCTGFINSKKAERPFIFIVFENPTLQDLHKGVIGQGKRGEYLNNLINAVGIKENCVHLTSLLRCRPHRNRQPTQEEFTTCRKFLFNEILELDPTIIVTLGAVATNAIINRAEPFQNIAGKWFETKTKKLVFPTYSFDRLITNPALKEPVFKHFKEIKTVLDKYLPENNIRQEALF